MVSSEKREISREFNDYPVNAMHNNPNSLIEPVKKPAEPAPPAVTTPPPAEPKAPAGVGVPFPSLYLGLSFGGHFVLTDWDLGELDETSLYVMRRHGDLARRAA